MGVDGRLEELQPYAIHGTRYCHAYYTHLVSPDNIYSCQLAFDAIDEEPRPGDPIRNTYLLKTVMEIRRALSSC